MDLYRLLEMKDVTAITVTYNTPTLIHEAITSIRLFYPTLPIIIMDGSPTASECHIEVDALAKKFKHVKVVHIHRNIGHGPGMDAAIGLCTTKYVLLFDSDIEIKRERVIERMLSRLTFVNTVYGVGQIVSVNQNGFNSIHNAIPYLHPHFALIKRLAYKKFKPFIQHGAPCIATAKDIAANPRGYFYMPFPVSEFVLHKERGTVNVVKQAQRLQAKNRGMKHQFARAV